MDRFLARQPILTTGKLVFAYEILSRFSPENYCRPPDGEAVHVNAIDELFLFGLKQMTLGLPAFLNCTREFLKRDYLELFPQELVVGEILETVTPDAEVLAACKRMKNKGYRLALDDYLDSPEMAPLFEFADFVKVDFLSTSVADQDSLAQKFRSMGIRLLAEKVETQEQFQRGIDMGYELFQGYFFCRPEMMKRHELPANKIVQLRLIEASSQPQMDLQLIADLVKQEVSLSHRLLRYLNSPVFPLAIRVQSIPHALSLLGERATRKWLSVVCVTAIGEDKPSELLKVGLTRARFCELLAEDLNLGAQAEQLFLLGLLSVIDALLDMSRPEVLAGLGVADEIKDALNGQPSPFRPIFDLVLDYESGNWDLLSNSSCAIGLKEQSIPDLYKRAIEWADQIMAETPVAI
jgi:c-di-GMP-related signal transduction protein